MKIPNIKKALAGVARPVNVFFDSNVLKMARRKAEPSRKIMPGIKYPQPPPGATLKPRLQGNGKPRGPAWGWPDAPDAEFRDGKIALQAVKRLTQLAANETAFFQMKSCSNNLSGNIFNSTVFLTQIKLGYLYI